MMRCDLCGTTAKCVQKEIDGREFDLCEPCWKPFAEKLAGKGRPKAAPKETEQAREYEEVVY
jgi:ribosome-binding protein aMBF1 (putative translation factor)